MNQFSQDKAQQLDDLCGYIFMKNSPSCGVYRVKVYQKNGYPAADAGRGVYAKAVMEAPSLLPVEESGRLADATLRENFITRVSAYHNWQQLKQQEMSYHAIIEFHASYKYCLIAHSTARYVELGPMLADAGKHDVADLAERYFTILMTDLSSLASRKTHANVLMHLQGYLKKVLSAQEKQEISKINDQYLTAQVPLIVPITILKHHFTHHPDPYIAKQTYLQPYPEDLSLRNAI
jgi:uncharacterized protein YbgA (DUF1722 family)